jgi:hypothetical protein
MYGSIGPAASSSSERRPLRDPAKVLASDAICLRGNRIPSRIQGNIFLFRSFFLAKKLSVGKHQRRM